MLAKTVQFTSVFTNICSCRWGVEDEFPLQERIVVYSRIFVKQNTYIMTN